MQKGRKLFARLEDRFWEKVDRSGGPDACWPWHGANRDGYGMLRVKGKWRQATHVALELAGRPLKSGERALHSCDNPPCCNAQHLTAGSNADNSAEMVAKGRSAGGGRNARAELSIMNVRAIRMLHTSGFNCEQISRAMKLSGTHVRGIVARRNWRYDN